MILTDNQIEYIEANLKFYGVASEALREDLLDHICTFIETGDFTDFETAYRGALQRFGGYSALGSLQKETHYQLYEKKNIRRKRVVYFSGFLAAFLLSTGVLFKLFHWPFAGIILFSGFIALNLILLPVLFYERYKNAIQKTI
ncbi:hypothetical protein [Flavobacterium limnosediminis]|uniref:hypothetical protein n=1 Tax=Flavobacterium limnosediminis TaxID=1401027 RepID=UPI000413718D|nr:hypothetical protein [Flavobacterium limnosediminis]